ncbi:hypothetical protein KI809_18380 [Geobacter pelophilus]|uniref:Uncharacterized protein n=1 Tax=Geoanaerobacter pelophilus TaxID=60036 RepID=A0AAW4L9R4_9BACT|nr:hypothetical protein [Geoanaerobacter pelophilus]MBT0666282.1 hypothetical protein [Geoanaerobacter pelophilus]
MTELEVHLPHKSYLAAPAATGPACPFCGQTVDYRKGTACSRCSTLEPSYKSEITIPAMLKRQQARKKPRKRAAVIYQPEIDGLLGAAPVDQEPELAPYQDDLDRLEVETDHLLELADDTLLPLRSEIDALPWD